MRLTLLLLAGHLLFCLARIPHAVIGKRHKAIRNFEHLGPATFLHDSLGGADALQALRSRTPPNAVVLYRGAWRGSMEIAPRALYPRMLVAEQAVPIDARSYKGRPLASGTIDGHWGVLVLVGKQLGTESQPAGTDLELVSR